MSFCKECGKQLGDNVRFCPQCGTEQIVAKSVSPEVEQVTTPVQEPVYNEPVYQEPVHQEPVYNEPVYQEPVYQEPVYKEPVYEQPVQSQPVNYQAVNQEPVNQQPVQSEYQQPVQPQPVYQQPVQPQSMYQQPTNSQQINSQPVYQQPIYQQQPVTSQPMYQQPVTSQPMHQQPMHQQPMHQQPMNNVPPMPKKKKSKKALIAVLAAIVLVVGAFGVIMFTPLALGLKNKINMTIQSPEKYYKSLEKQNKDITIKRLGNAYDKYVNAFKSNEGSTVEFDLSVGASESFLYNYGLPTSLTEVELTTNSAYLASKGFAGEYGLKINGEKFVDLKAYFDSSNNQLLATVPQLSDKYLYMDLTEVIEDLTGSMDFSDLDKFKELQLTKEELQDLLTRYTDILVEASSNVKREKNVTLEIGESSGKYTKITSRIDEKDAANIAIAILKEAKNDKTIIKLVEGFDVSKEEYKDQIDDLIDQIEEEKDGFTSDEELVIELYVDSKGTIVGRNISFEDEFNAGYYVIKDKDSLDFELFFEASGTKLKASTSAQIKNEKYTGELVLSMEEYGFTNEVTISYKDVQQVEKNGQTFINGIFELDLSPFVAANSSIRVECNEADSKQYTKISYVDNGEEAVWVKIGLAVKNGAKVDIPKVNINEAYNMMDEYDMQEYFSTIDILKLIDPIQEIVYEYGELFSFGGFGDYDDEWSYNDYDYGVDFDQNGNYVGKDDTGLYDYNQENIVGEWLVEETGEYYVFTLDNLVYRYKDSTMDPNNCYVGYYSAFAPAYDKDYNLIPGLDIIIDYSETWNDGVDGGYDSANYELVETEFGFGWVNFDTQEMFTITKIR